MNASITKDLSRARTCEVLMGKQPTDDGREDWLGCVVGKGAAIMNQMLSQGATREELAEKARGGVNEHLRTLREKHGLPIWQEESTLKLKFDYLVLGVAQKDLVQSRN